MIRGIRIDTHVNGGLFGNRNHHGNRRVFGGLAVRRGGGHHNRSRGRGNGRGRFYDRHFPGFGFGICFRLGILRGFLRIGLLLDIHLLQQLGWRWLEETGLVSRILRGHEILPSGSPVTTAELATAFLVQGLGIGPRLRH